MPSSRRAYAGLVKSMCFSVDNLILRIYAKSTILEKIMQNMTMSIEEVAEAIGRTPRAVRRHCQKWHRTKGFPLPIPLSIGTGNWRWLRGAMGAFLHTQTATGVNDNHARDNHAGDNHATSIIEAQRMALHRHYGEKNDPPHQNPD